ncbi:hypothetical protein [Psychroserpens mesophilus]|uniref:hypothetical protein n=1 Tax=Psychroserpens mesophilus TaxID=325473 RepID=UPI003F49A69B
MKHSILFLVITTVCLSCGNDDTILNNERALPPITQNGANTFGCYIDQLLFIPRDGDGTFSTNDNAMIFWGGGIDNDYNEIDVHDYNSEKTASLLMHIQGLHDNGIASYIVNESNGQNGIDGLNHTYMHCRVWRKDVGNYQNYLSYENSGNITITSFNLYSGIISGTFSGSVRNYQEPHDTIQITQGRFDINGFTLPDANFQ